ncbi:hypothetical protein [Spiroplasma turonicum]|uniref:Transmembrane protein n=1 Tax=Spiroplasma turonicum TaxID=216946 RepID=A0A0K1P8R3_9MOLU|nr:hypothetical protein [Spiroplasma turonicum]AKU80287.1 hypothetical protein STURON_001041 [Spiroplasma turonicum]ALX71288.1 hypothetical protein STURO_v1c10370 [Spiroplasma turonicum]
MYINPFERMKKQKEDEVKKEAEKQKEKEKYIRLGAQMGFVDNKDVIPSFIKTMLDDNNKVSVPPFPGLSDNYSSQQPSWSDSNSNSYNKFNDLQSTNTQQIMNNSYNFPFENQLVNDEIKDANNFQNNSLDNKDTTSKFKETYNINNNISINNEKDLVVENDIFKNLKSPLSTINESILPIEDIKESIKEPIYTSFEHSTKDNYLNEIEEDCTFLKLDEYKEYFNNENLDNKLLMIPVDKKNNRRVLKYIKTNISNLYSIFIDVSEISKYRRPYRFFLKQLISKLPIQIDLEDRRELWERVDLMLKGTSWGQIELVDDFEDIMDEVFVVDDPVDLIVSEFKNLFESYNFTNRISVFVDNFIPIDINLKKSFIEFFNKIVVKIPNLNLTFMTDSDFYKEFSKEYIFEYVDIIIKMVEKNNLNKKLDNNVLSQEKSFKEVNEEVLNFTRLNNDFLDNDSSLKSVINTLSSLPPSSSTTNATELNLNKDISLPNQSLVTQQPSFMGNQNTNLNSFNFPNQNEPPNSFNNKTSLLSANSDASNKVSSILNSKMRIDVGRVLEKQQIELDKINKKEEWESKQKTEGPIFRTEILADSSISKNNDKNYNLFDRSMEVGNQQISISENLYSKKQEQEGNNLFTIQGSNWENLNKKEVSMFAFLIISAWSIVITSSVVLIAYLTLSLLLTMIAKVAILMKIYNLLSGHPYSSVAGNDSSFLVNATNMANKELGAFIMLGVLIFIALTLIIVASIELSRLRKKQKISKPFVKAYLLLLVVAFMLISQTILLIVAGSLVFGLVILEFVLFDNDALNNYAEERNLISINREEKKFEREVAKEGKQNGNVTLKKIESNQEKNRNGLIKNIDKDALPSDEHKLDIKYRKKHQRWKKQRNSLIELRNQIISSKENTKQNVIDKLINSFNYKAKKINDLASQLEIPNSFFVEYIYQDSMMSSTINDENSIFELIEDIEVETTLEDDYKDDNFNNEQAKENLNIETFTTEEMDDFESAYPEYGYGNQNSLGEEFLKEKLSRAINMDLSDLKLTEDKLHKNDILSTSSYDQHGILDTLVSEQNEDSNNYLRPVDENVFKRPETRIDSSAPSTNALGEQFIKEKMTRAINMDLDVLIESRDEKETELNNIFKDYEVYDSNAYDKYNQEEKLIQKPEPTTFKRPETRIDQTISTPNIFNDLEITNQNVFKRPETRIDSSAPSTNALGEQFIKEKMARAINMDLDVLIESRDEKETELNNIFKDYEVYDSNAYDKYNQEEKLIQKPEPTTFKRPETRIDQTISTPNIFNDLEITNQNVFKRPETRIDSSAPSTNALGEQFIKEKMARAINMDLDVLIESRDEKETELNNIFKDYEVYGSNAYDKYNQEEKLIQKPEPTTFKRPETRIDQTISTPNIFNDLEITNQNVFKRPETRIDSSAPSTNALGEQFIKEKMARAIDESINNLSSTTKDNESNINELFDNFKIKTSNAYDKYNQEEKLIQKPEPTTFKRPETRIDQTISTPNIFNDLEITNQNVFKRPETRIDSSAPSTNALGEQFIKEKMARAIDESINNLSSTTNDNESNINELFDDFKLFKLNKENKFNHSNDSVIEYNDDNVILDLKKDAQNIALEADLKNILDLEIDDNNVINESNKTLKKIDSIESRISSIEKALNNLNQEKKSNDYKQELDIIMNKLDLLYKEMEVSKNSKREHNVLLKKYEYNKKRNH